MNPLKIERHAPGLFAAFSRSRFVGWLKHTPEGWRARPKGWRECLFESEGQAKRYLIASIKK